MHEIKVEKRGKYGGVKVHLDAPQCNLLLAFLDAKSGSSEWEYTFDLLLDIAKAIKTLLKKEPSLLEDRTPEEIAAILAKESEKAALQLARFKEGKDWSKVDPGKLQEALLKHVK